MNKFQPVEAPCCKRQVALFFLVDVSSHPGFEGIERACGSCITDVEREFIIAARNIVADKPLLIPDWTSQEATVVRAERNRRLTASDWCVLPDSPLSSSLQDEWRAYRAALRDITQQFASPVSVIWPTPPQ